MNIFMCLIAGAQCALVISGTTMKDENKEWIKREDCLHLKNGSMEDSTTANSHVESEVCDEVKSAGKPILEAKLMDKWGNGRPFLQSFQVYFQDREQRTLRLNCSAMYPIRVNFLGYEHTVIQSTTEKNQATFWHSKQIDLVLPQKKSVTFQVRCSSIKCVDTELSSTLDIKSSDTVLNVAPLLAKGHQSDTQIKPSSFPGLSMIIMAAFGPTACLLFFVALAICVALWERCRRTCPVAQQSEHPAIQARMRRQQAFATTGIQQRDQSV